MASESYDMRSNIKAKPGSQGTLFQVKDKGVLNPQQRWPQGYTPERLNDVREGLRNTTVTSPPDRFDHPLFNEHAYRERLTREIARTTVPAEDLRGLASVHSQPNPGTDGTYWPSRRELAVDLSEGDRDNARRTLVHELGHHHDNLFKVSDALLPDVAAQHAVKTWPHEGAPNMSAVYQARSRVAKGVGEAVADNYAEQHFRTGGRKSQGTTTGAYEVSHTPQQMDQHYPGYNAIRPPAALQPSQFQPGLFPVPGSQSELRRRLAQASATRHAVGENLR